MNCRIEISDIFFRRLKILSKRYKSLKQDLERLEKELEQNPFLGTDLGNHLRKIRLSVTSKEKRKRGGARVVTYTLTLQEDYVEITLLTIYDKSDTANIPTPELLRIAKECGL